MRRGHRAEDREAKCELDGRGTLMYDMIDNGTGESGTVLRGGEQSREGEVVCEFVCMCVCWGA